MSSTNRIPRDSVSFSNEQTKINNYFVKSFNNEEMVIEEDFSEQVKNEELLKKEKLLIEKEQKLNLLFEEIEENKKIIEEMKNDFKKEKNDFYVLSEKEKSDFESKKAIEIIKIKDFMWDATIEIAEKVVRQEIDRSNVELCRLFEGILKELPVSFQKLEVIANPETVELIKKKSSKTNWLFEDIVWKYNFDLEIGDFIIEHEEEMYNAIITKQFEIIKEEIKKMKDES